MKRTHLAAVAVMVASSAACAPGLERCNTDGDCGARACVLGVCVAPEGDAVGVDAAPADGEGPNPVDVRPGGAGSGLDGGCEGALAFADLDGDGVGAGERVCVDVGAPGFVDVGGDCDDLDAGAFEARTMHVDVDGDGFTAGEPVIACVGDTAPEGLTFERGAPPVHVVEPALVQRVSGAWDTRRIELAPGFGPASGTVRLSQLACASSPPAEVAGVEVHLRLLSTAPSFADVTVSLEGGTETRTATVFTDGTPVVLGADDDTFGAILDPAAVCNGTLALRVTVTTTTSARVRVAAALRVHGPGDDCDDFDPTAFSPAALRDDGDGDGHAAGFAATTCVGDALPPAKRVRATDCDDLDGAAFPGQTASFLRQRFGGGFDFNCNAVEERQVAEVRVVTGCERTGQNNNGCREHAEWRVLPCGATDRIAERCNAQCDKVFRDVVQTCR